MTTPEVAILVTCSIAGGGALVYIGRSLNTLTTIDKNQTELFKRSNEQADDISELKTGLAVVKTKQEDCKQCP